MNLGGMKSYFFLFFLIIKSKNIFAQPDVSNIVVEYNVKHIIDTTNNFSISYPLLLIANGNNSYSISRNKFVSDSLEKANPVTISNIGGGFIIKSNNLGSKRLSSFESVILYNDFVKKIQIEKIEIGSQKYLMIDSSDNPLWEIKSAYKNINGYNCQLAKTKYKGRIWDVWFSNEIAIPNGPWKLKGLPGLILEATDSLNQVSFTLNGIAYQKRIVQKPESHEIITRKEYFNLLKAYAEDPMAFFENQQGVKINFSDFKSDNGFPVSDQQSRKKLKLPNNPIELE